MKNSKLLLILPVILLIIVGFVAYKKTGGTTQPSPISSSTQVTDKITITIDFGIGGQVKQTYQFEQGITAFSTLERLTKEKELKLETKKYDFGVYVQSINSLKSGGDLAWIYFVNGKSADKAADLYMLSSGDLVEWKYIKPNF